MPSANRLSLIVYLLALVVSDWPTPTVQAEQLDNDYHLYVPLVMRLGVPAPLPVFDGAFFVEPNTKTGSASLAVDVQGGLHLAYGYYLPDVEHPAAVYLYCPPTSDCVDPANWNGVSMGDYVNEVQLALTPAGQPRLLFRGSSTVYTNGNDYFYGACDQACTDPGQWSVVYLLSNSAAIFELNDRITPQRSFALDPQGRPRFVYQDYNYGIDPDHLGAYYVFCDVDCANPAPAQPRWFETRISEEINEPFNYRYEVFEWPSLTFTRQGQPRLVANVTPIQQNQEGVYYLACDSLDNRERVRLYERGSGPEATWDLEVDGSDRPRLAYVNQSGGSPGYARCDVKCESAQAQWQATVVETATNLAQEFPVALPPHCQTGLWDSFAPVLALDGAGHPRLAYDSKYEAYCLYDDPNDGQPPYYHVEQVWHVVRAVLIPQPFLLR